VTETIGRATRRSLFPLVWLVGAAPVAGLSANLLPSSGAVVARGITDSYYVVAHNHVVSLATAFVLMAGVYAVLDFAQPSYRRPLAWTHFGLMSLGAALSFAPMVFLSVAGTPQRFVDPIGLFKTLSVISSLGYLVMIIGAVVFALLVIDVFVRRIARR